MIFEELDRDEISEHEEYILHLKDQLNKLGRTNKILIEFLKYISTYDGSALPEQIEHKIDQTIVKIGISRPTIGGIA